MDNGLFNMDGTRLQIERLVLLVVGLAFFLSSPMAPSKIAPSVPYCETLQLL